MEKSDKYLIASLLIGTIGFFLVFSVDIRIAIGISLLLISNSIFDGFNIERKKERIRKKNFLDLAMGIEIGSEGWIENQDFNYIITILGKNPSVNEVAEYCESHYQEITGLPAIYRFNEENFPVEIVNIVDHYKLDWTEFTDAWSMIRGSYQ